MCLDPPPTPCCTPTLLTEASSAADWSKSVLGVSRASVCLCAALTRLRAKWNLWPSMGSLLASSSLSFPVRCTCSHTGPLRVTCNGFLFNIYSGCRCRCCCAAVLHFKINIWILISKKFTLGYASSVRCLLNPGSRQAPSRGAVTGGEGLMEGVGELCVYICWLPRWLVTACAHLSQSLSLWVCECASVCIFN